MKPLPPINDVILVALAQLVDEFPRNALWQGVADQNRDLAEAHLNHGWRGWRG